MSKDPPNKGDPWLTNYDPFGEVLPLEVIISTINEVRYEKYSKLKITSVFKLEQVYHCETKCGKYLWVEAHRGSVVMCLAETSNEIGNFAEPVARYSGSQPSHLSLELIQIVMIKIFGMIEMAWIFFLAMLYLICVAILGLFIFIFEVE